MRRNDKSSRRNGKSKRTDQKSSRRNDKSSRTDDKSMRRNDKSSRRNQKSMRRDDKSSRTNDKSKRRNETFASKDGLFLNGNVSSVGEIDRFTHRTGGVSWNSLVSVHLLDKSVGFWRLFFGEQQMVSPRCQKPPSFRLFKKRVNTFFENASAIKCRRESNRQQNFSHGVPPLRVIHPVVSVPKNLAATRAQRLINRMTPTPDAPPENQIPLVVDLDGTLIRTDLLWEHLARLLRRNPLWILPVLIWWLCRGRAYLKKQLARRVKIDPAALPYHEKFLAFLREQKSAGRKLVLATASDLQMALPVAGHTGLFDEVLGSDGKTNLRGGNKLKALVEFSANADLITPEIQPPTLPCGAARARPSWSTQAGACCRRRHVAPRSARRSTTAILRLQFSNVS